MAAPTRAERYEAALFSLALTRGPQLDVVPVRSAVPAARRLRRLLRRLGRAA